MSDRRDTSATSSDVLDMPIDDVMTIQGDVPPDEQDGVLDPDEIERVRTPTRTELDHGEPSPDPTVAGGEMASLDSLDLEDLREGETDDPIAATEEGLSYVPPIDPPVRTDADEEDGLAVAAGTAVSAESEPYDDDHRATDLDAESDMNGRIRAALRADAATSPLADQLIVGTRGSVAVIRGAVQDVDDSDNIIEVVSRVDGITDVVDETELTG